MEQTNPMEMDRTDAPMTAREISGELMEDAAIAREQDAAQTEAAIREGIAELFEDGWSAQELEMLSQNMGVREDVAAGLDVVRAACKYLRAQLEDIRGREIQRRRGVPVARVSGTGGAAAHDHRIDAMSDAQFDAFSRQARAAAMMGKRVRM